MIVLITCFFVLLFLFGVPLIILSERWIPLLGSIFRGDSSHLKDDMLESGICEKHREGWVPPIKTRPVRFMFDNLGLQPWTPPPEWKPTEWKPPKRILPKWTPMPPQDREKEPELEKLAQELFAELE